MAALRCFSPVSQPSYKSIYFFGTAETSKHQSRPQQPTKPLQQSVKIWRERSLQRRVQRSVRVAFVLVSRAIARCRHLPRTDLRSRFCRRVSVRFRQDHVKEDANVDLAPDPLQPALTKEYVPRLQRTSHAARH